MIRGTAPAADGYTLAISRFPAQGTPWANVLVAGAMGVRQDFYAPFARWLAEQGANILTFDYRGMGASRPADLASLRADIDDWAMKDANAMLGHALAPAPRLPLLLVGHSLGGQLFGVLPDRGRVHAAVTVCAGSGWYGFNGRAALQARLLWFVLVPLLTPLFGYFPGKRLRVVGDLPRGVALQWRRWCMHRDYLLHGDARARAAYASVTAPLLGWSFEDDEYLTRECIDHLHGFYPAAAIDRRHGTPAELGLPRIGHFGFFAERAREALWQPTLDWMRRQCAQSRVRPASRLASVAAASPAANAP